MPSKKKELIRGNDFVIIRVVEVEIHRDEPYDSDIPSGFPKMDYAASLKDLMDMLHIKDTP